jgi:hypothetical protein
LYLLVQPLERKLEGKQQIRQKGSNSSWYKYSLNFISARASDFALLYGINNCAKDYVIVFCTFDVCSRETLFRRILNKVFGCEM